MKIVECYYPGCTEHGNTKEHIPPKSFFPEGKRINLMTVKSCPKHNNEKTKDDIYVLAQICFNAIENANDIDANDVFEKKVIPQLKHNNGALERTIMKSRVRIPGGYEFPVDLSRMNAFFDCLTHGVLYKKINKKIDLTSYRIQHLYRDFSFKSKDQDEKKWEEFRAKLADSIFLNDLLNSVNFSFVDKKLNNQEIYTVKIMGTDSVMPRDELTSSITMVHTFYGKFRVISGLTRITNFENTPVHFTIPDKTVLKRIFI